MKRALIFAFFTASVSLSRAAGPELPAGPLKAKIQTTCTQCHDTKIIVKQRHDKEWWSGTLEKMIDLGAQVDDKDREGFIKYLSSHFSDRGGTKKN